jgi:hypothetical protein
VKSGGRGLARRSIAIAVLALLGAAPVGAQTIRGTVIEETSKLPIQSVLITLVDASGADLLPGVRTDSMGTFIIHANQAGTWRVKGMRLGYRPMTSEPVSLAVGALAVVRLRMTTIAQQLLPVQVIENRQMTASELMSTIGFNQRESRGQGRFLSGERLEAMGRDGVREVLATQFQPTLFVFTDPVLGDVLRIRQGLGQCEPEVYLDGKLLATTPEPSALLTDPTPPANQLDSLRERMRVEWDQERRGFGQVYALTLLTSLPANALHGIEVYRGNELPPPSLGAWFGMTRATTRGCGTVAIWTKAGARSVVAARSGNATGRAIQVISGTLVDFDTGKPLVGIPVALLAENRDEIGKPVMSGEGGSFTLRTSRAGDFRLSAGGSDYATATTPAFGVSADEMVVVRFSLATRGGVLAPLGVAARILPQKIGVASRGGFTYRRERGQGGAFFRAADIERLGARSIIDVVRGVDGIGITDAPRTGTIVIEQPGAAPRCTPVFYLDGRELGETAQSVIAEVPMTRVFGVEVYAKSSEIPGLFVDAGRCGVIVVWTKP